MAQEGVGSVVASILEEAGERYLGPRGPKVREAFLMQLGGTRQMSAVARNAGYWRWVQALLDCFFTAEQRAEICACLLQRVEFGAWPESRDFQAMALAEQRLQALLAAGQLVSHAPAR